MKNYDMDKQDMEVHIENTKKEFLPAEIVVSNTKFDINGEEIPEGITFSVLQVLKDNKYSIGTDGKRYIVKGENLDLVK